MRIFATATVITLLLAGLAFGQAGGDDQIASFQAELLGPGWATAVTQKDGTIKVWWTAHPEFEPALQALVRSGDLMIRDSRLWVVSDKISLDRIGSVSPALRDFLQTNAVHHMALVDNLNVMFQTERRKITMTQTASGWDVTYLGRPGLELPLEALLNTGKAVRKDGAPFLKPLAAGELLDALNRADAVLQPIVAENRDKISATIPRVTTLEQQMRGLMTRITQLEGQFTAAPWWLVAMSTMAFVGVLLLAFDRYRPRGQRPAKKNGVGRISLVALAKTGQAKLSGFAKRFQSEAPAQPSRPPTIRPVDPVSSGSKGYLSVPLRKPATNGQPPTSGQAATPIQAGDEPADSSEEEIRFMSGAPHQLIDGEWKEVKRVDGKWREVAKPPQPGTAPERLPPLQRTFGDDTEYLKDLRQREDGRWETADGQFVAVPPPLPSKR